ncbi:MAG: hypothetical protein EPO28_01835 [Saprospiraceae bacterium]|nr:MAG: hypothetical protein EPO28_01835 [Saprospiraceae bacterium]
MEETTKISPLEIVQQVYADFGSGNIPGVPAALTDKVEWTGPGQVNLISGQTHQNLHDLGEVKCL